MKFDRFTLPLAAALATAVAAPAVAGSYDPAPEPVQVAPAAPAPVLGGDWGGGYAGLQLGFADVDADGGLNGDGEIYGVHAGYRWDMGTLVYGVEVDYDDAGIDIGNGAAELDDVMRLKGQVGYDMGSTLLYATAGVANADTTLGDETGWLAGGGLAWAVSPSWTVGGEILYHDFDEFGNSGIGADATTATLRASFRF
ncbi:outer membrane protein [Rhodovulum euryhalinum]|uniref:Opacity protein-like surface antigen n=1 Tax=Rhodovulum euryhalinum TaxID=35805 RepID=A0A4R2KFH5_9RHOB|nr:outer membrane beta-barrel protein [Rhodovulum euryhalinum]TCO72431.1 opacity protein-like surface antigen [Rhodovulum euryhalinum]